MSDNDPKVDSAGWALRMSDTKEVSKDQCPDCEGDGSAYQQITAGDQTAEEYAGSCPICNGTGLKPGKPAATDSSRVELAARIEALLKRWEDRAEKIEQVIGEGYKPGCRIYADELRAALGTEDNQ